MDRGDRRMKEGRGRGEGRRKWKARRLTDTWREIGGGNGEDKAKSRKSRGEQIEESRNGRWEGRRESEKGKRCMYVYTCTYVRV